MWQYWKQPTIEILEVYGKMSAIVYTFDQISTDDKWDFDHLNCIIGDNKPIYSKYDFLDYI